MHVGFDFGSPPPTLVSPAFLEQPNSPATVVIAGQNTVTIPSPAPQQFSGCH